MKINATVLASSLLGALVISTAINSPAFAQSAKPKTNPSAEPEPVTKITPVQAMAAAQAKVGGVAKMALFEFDEGHWIYGVVIVKGGKMMEVDVDPITGKAGNVETVTPEDEAKEFRDALSKMVK